MMPQNFTDRPLSPDLPQDVAVAMGRQGGCYGCWYACFCLAPPE
ncbi:hypothetical protein ACQQ2Q_00305 [Agrobacterium sp. ES01]